ncbi:MAG: hypothetical protein LBP61_03265 [Desulfovibrio sp.]|nr:hypothetical protein [Desulfovibrio sp.]
MIKVLSGNERAGALAEAREKARMDLDFGGTPGQRYCGVYTGTADGPGHLFQLGQAI